MTLTTMADRALPLAERVQAALLCWDMDDAHAAARAALLADVAAADRLARVTFSINSAMNDAPYRGLSDAEWAEHECALDAYRARMQGVARG